VVAQKAPDEKTNKPKASWGKGDRVADQSSLSRASWIVRHLCSDSLEPMRTVRLTQLNSPAATRGHNVHSLSSIDIQKLVHRNKKSSKTFVRLVKVVPTFEKVVPCNRPTKQLRSPAKATWPNKNGLKGDATSVVCSSNDYMVLPTSLFTAIYFPVQAWGSAAINPYYMYHSFAYSGWGNHNL
jgi:hypothetical protein